MDGLDWLKERESMQIAIRLLKEGKIQLRQRLADQQTELARLKARLGEKGEVPEMPWNCHELFGWSIVGMNHYKQDGPSHLFVAMTKGGLCIQAGGINEKDVFAQLKNAAMEIPNCLAPAPQAQTEGEMVEPFSEREILLRGIIQKFITKYNSGEKWESLELAELIDEAQEALDTYEVSMLKTKNP